MVVERYVPETLAAEVFEHEPIFEFGKVNVAFSHAKERRL
jgi:hypothetical protein